jgi:hypothetical protein
MNPQAKNGLAELLTIPENMNSQPLFSGVCVALSLVLSMDFSLLM